MAEMENGKRYVFIEETELHALEIIRRESLRECVNLNAQIQRYKKEIKDLIQENIRLQKNNQDDLFSLRSQRAELQAQLVTLDEDIAKLEG